MSTSPWLVDTNKFNSITDDVTLSNLENIVREIRQFITEDDTTATFWLNLHNVKQGDEYRYREMTQGVIRMLCLPLSNAEVKTNIHKQITK